MPALYPDPALYPGPTLYPAGSGSSYSNNTTDSSTTSDSVSYSVIRAVRTVAISETLSTLDNSAWGYFINNRAIGEILSIAASGTRQTVTFRGTLEALSISDLPARSTIITRSIFEHNPISNDTPSIVRNMSRSITETLSGITTSVVINKSSSIIILTSLVTGDTITRTQRTGKNILDQIVTSDSITKIHNNSISLFNTLVTSESPSRMVLLHKTPADSVTGVDTLTRSASRTKIINEITSLVESVARNTLTSRGILEITSLSDVVARRVAPYRLINDSLITSDLLSRVKHISAYTADSLTTHDNLVRGTKQFFLWAGNISYLANFQAIRIVSATLPLMYLTSWGPIRIGVISSPFEWNLTNTMTINVVPDIVRPDVNRHRSQTFLSGHVVRNT